MTQATKGLQGLNGDRTCQETMETDQNEVLLGVGWDGSLDSDSFRKTAFLSGARIRQGGS